MQEKLADAVAAFEFKSINHRNLADVVQHMASCSIEDRIHYLMVCILIFDRVGLFTSVNNFTPRAREFFAKQIPSPGTKFYTHKS